MPLRVGGLSNPMQPYALPLPSASQRLSQWWKALSKSTASIALTRSPQYSSLAKAREPVLLCIGFIGEANPTSNKREQRFNMS